MADEAELKVSGCLLEVHEYWSLGKMSQLDLEKTGNSIGYE